MSSLTASRPPDTSRGAVRNYPWIWFRNVSALLEKRTFSPLAIFFFCLFVGSMRRFLEWILGGVPDPFPLSFVVTLTGFYWFTFFVFTTVLRLLVPQPWRTSMNVILVGIFLGIFPPLLDTLFSGTGFQYAYVWGVPSEFNWYLYNPKLNIPIGEAIVLWTVIFFTTLYVAHKTRSMPRTLAALSLSYGGVIVIGGLPAGLAMLFGSLAGWQPTHYIALVNLLQIAASFVLFVALQPAVRRWFVRRTAYLAVMGAFVLAGSLWVGGLGPGAFAYAALFVIVVGIALAVLSQRSEGGGGEMEREDAQMLAVMGGMLLLALAAANALGLIPLALAALGLLFLAGFGLGVQKFSRALLFGGLLAVCAFLLGITAAAEQAAYGAPRWWIAFLPQPAEPGALYPWDSGTLAALAVIFAAASAIVPRLLPPAARRERISPPREGRPAVLHAFLGSLVVAGGGLLAAWMAGGEPPEQMLAAWLSAAATLWLGLFWFASVARVFGRFSAPRALAGALPWIGLGLFPPAIAVLTARSDAVPWTPVGMEGWGLVWWVAALSCAIWVGLRAGALRGLATLGAGWLGGVAVLALPGTAAALAVEAAGWPPGHRITTENLMRVVLAMALYLAVRPRLLAGLAGRIPHALPFLLFCFLGSAYAGSVSATTAVYAFLMFLAGWVALGQNDFFDRAEDDLQGRRRYLDADDVRFLTLTAVLGLLILAAAHSGNTFLALIAFATFMLYNFPFYRAKRYFPSNLKIEGIWGFCAFGFGVVAAHEQLAYGAPRWWTTHSPALADPAFTGPFEAPTLVAMFLAFGGFSLVAVLKDYKDWPADRDAGVQTPYTLAARRGWPLQKLHAGILVTTAAALAAAPLLLAVEGRITWIASPSGVAAGALVAALMAGPPSASRFRAALVTLSLFFLFLIGALHAG